MEEDVFGRGLERSAKVSGHGVGAALLSVSVMNTLRSQSLPDIDFRDCKQVLESLTLNFQVKRIMICSLLYGTEFTKKVRVS